MDKCRKDQILLLLVIDKYILIRILTISLELLPSWSATLTDLRLAFSVTGEKAANNPKDRREEWGEMRRRESDSLDTSFFVFKV